MIKQISTIIFMFSCFGCSQINDDPVAAVKVDFDWNIDDLNPCQVYFINTSANSKSYIWDFGDGDSSFHKNPIHDYSKSGSYQVTLFAIENGVIIGEKSKIIQLIKPPEDPATILNNGHSKKWKLYRNGIAATLGPNATDYDKWWSGLLNDGSRSCLYKHEFIFHANGTYQFLDNGEFWGDAQIWEPQSIPYEQCFNPDTVDMTVDGIDLTPWLSGTHSYELDLANNLITLKGKGAWIGFPFLGTMENHGINIPDSVTIKFQIKDYPSYDLMTINFDHGQNGYWTFIYVNYDDWKDEPPVIN